MPLVWAGIITIKLKRLLAPGHDTLSDYREPELFAVYQELAREIDVSVRGGPQRFIRDAVASSQLRATTAIVGDWTGTGVGMPELAARIRKCAAENPTSPAVEVVTHPGYSDSLLRSRTSLSDMREDDLRDVAALRQAWSIELDGFALTNFAEL